jgi:hypothetical protein
MRSTIGSVFPLLVLGFSQALLGQAVNATLLGTVTDATGAAVANAKVTATEATTGALHQSATNESGNYTFPDLQPGPYTVTIEAKGFKRVTQENINLLSNSATRVDLTLVPGNVTETVTVTTEPPTLQTDRADISTKIESEKIEDMALGSNRNFQSLLNVVPGTTPAVFQHSQFFNAASSLQTEVNGLPRQGNLYQIEGIDDDERTGLLQIIIPPAEAIDTVDVSTNNFEAELGRATGAVTNVTLKSGSNKLHGSAYEFIQNNDLNARPFFSTLPLGHLSYNYFGGAIGGPVKKDKLFFFGDYLHTVDHEAISSTFTIPDARWYTPSTTLGANCTDPTGCIDLSGAISGGKGQIYDPTTYTNGTAHTGASTDPRPAFTNNYFPYSLVNPVSLAILQRIDAAAALYGKLNSTLPMSAPTNNYSTNLPFTKTTDSFDTKIDYTLNQKDHISGRFSFQRVVTFQQAAFGAFLGGPQGSGFEGTGDQKSYSTGVNYDHVFSPSFFTEARIGVAHLRNNAQTNDYGTSDATTIGITGVNILPSQPFTSGQAAISFTDNISNPLMGYSASEPWIRGEANIDFVNNWTMIRGNHTFKAGIDLRRVRDDLLQDQTYSPRGAFTFDPAQTTNAGGSTNLANDMASFLLDQPKTVGRDLNTFFPCYRDWWIFAYISDKWQVTPKLTADLGIRWEYYPPATPKSPGGFSNYNPANNTLVLAGLGGNPSNLGLSKEFKSFAPRTGISYRLRNDTVVRAGFGISFTPFPDNTYAYDYPVRANNSYSPGGNGANTPAVIPITTPTSSCPAYGAGYAVASFQCGFPAPVPVTIPANGIIPANTPFLTSQVYNVIGTMKFGSYSPNYINPYVMSWNVAVQQAFRGNLSLQLAYVANHGVRIDTSQNINLPLTYDGGAASDPENALFGRTAGTYVSFLGYSTNYQSLQVQLIKRVSYGLTFTSAFTWGKGLNYMSGDDGGGGASSGLMFYINQRRNYSYTDFDRKVNFEETFTYELPFGRGHKWLNNNKAADYAIGGWKLSGLVSVVSGLPFTVTASGTNLNTPGTGATAVLNGSFTVLHGIGSSSPWFKNDQGAQGSSATWQQPAGCTGYTAGTLSGSVYTPSTCTAAVVGLGNTGRNQFRGPGYIQDNLSMFKKFNVYREDALEFRIDAFQLSNTPQFANPTSSITSGSFGEVTSTLGSGQGSVNGVGGGRTLQGSLKLSF